MINKEQVIERLKYNASLWLQQLDEMDKRNTDKFDKQKELKKAAEAKAAAEKQIKITGHGVKPKTSQAATPKPKAPQTEKSKSIPTMNFDDRKEMQQLQNAVKNDPNRNSLDDIINQRNINVKPVAGLPGVDRIKTTMGSKARVFVDSKTGQKHSFEKKNVPL